jgi:hypothetical protein
MKIAAVMSNSGLDDGFELTFMGRFLANSRRF